MKAQHVTECELLVMKGIWSKDYDMALPEIVDTVNTMFDREWASQTVSTFLKRLVSRGFLKMTRKGRSFYYHEQISESDYASATIFDCCEFWCEGDASVMLEKLMQERKLSKKEKEKIKKMI